MLIFRKDVFYLIVINIPLSKWGYMIDYCCLEEVARVSPLKWSGGGEAVNSVADAPIVCFLQ